MIFKCRHLIVQKIIVQRFSRFLIKFQLFGKSESNSHTHASMHLRFRQRRIDQPSAVMYIDDIRQCGPASRNIYLYFRKGTAERVGIIFDLIGTLCREMSAVSQAVEFFCCQLTQ